MSSNTGLIPCPNLQDNLIQHFGDCDMTQLREPVGALEFLVSSANTNGVLQRQVSPGNGKKRTVELVYQSRILESAVSTSLTRTCTSTTKDNEEMQPYEVGDTGVSIDRMIDAVDLINHCEDDSMYYARQVQQWMDALIRKMDTQVVAGINALTGKFPVGSTNVTGEIKTITTKFPAASGMSGAYNPQGMADVAFASVNSGFCGKPVILGWEEVWQYAQFLESGCCSQSGLDVAAYHAKMGWAMIGDYRVTDLLGSTKFLVLDPGAAQLIWFNEFAGPRGIRTIDTETDKQYVIQDPATGIPFDFSATFDCGKWHFQMKLAFKVVGRPQDLFAVGDRLNGVTGVQEYVITNT